jgi:hypothetical protein
MSVRLPHHNLGIAIATLLVFFVTLFLFFFILGNPSQPATKLYGVTFEQVGVGECPFYGKPWSVTIGDKTQV